MLVTPYLKPIKLEFNLGALTSTNIHELTRKCKNFFIVLEKNESLLNIDIEVFHLDHFCS